MTPARVAGIGLSIVLGFLGVFSVWVATTTHEASVAVSRSSSVSDAYEAAHFAVATEESLGRKYRLEPSVGVLRAHRAAAAALVSALESARTVGTAQDTRLVGQVLDLHTAYITSTARMFAAVDRGDSSLAISIENGEVDPVFGAIETRVTQAAGGHKALAAAALDNLAAVEGFILVATRVVVVAGLVLLLLLWIAFRGYGRRLEAGAERELLLVRASEERFRSLVQNAADVLVIAGADGRFRYASPAVQRSWGYPPADLAGSLLSELVHPDDLDAARAFYAECVRSTGVNVATQLRVRTADGAWRDVEVIGYNLVEDESVNGVVLTMHDVTERKSFEQRLTKLAFRDQLTDLANRTLFADRLEQALARATRQMRSVGLLFLDIDNFKDVNDRLGHDAGDRLLVIVASRLREALRGVDTAARIGGDEFTILLEGLVDEEAAIEIVSRIETTLAEPVNLDGHELSVTASIGIAVGGSSLETPESIMRKADLAMYRAKANGKARHELFEPSMESIAMKRIELEADLRHALGHAEFRVVYQPIVSLEHGHLVGVEALVRWDHPTRGVVMPLDFIPFAEESGLIVPIGLAVLRKACAQGAIWNRDLPKRLGVSVNLSARQFQHVGLVDDIGLALSDSGLDPALLTLEITESDIMRDPLVAADRLREIKRTGVRIAVDDFGTGYSSLAYLKNFPVDSLKIDRTFISGVGVDKDDSAIVRSVVALGHALDLSVTGEGIETPAQRAYLQDLGCDLGQGYLFDRPMAADEIEAAVVAHSRTVSPVADQPPSRRTA